ncbi:MAG TPA: methyltransferase domain-containing protein [Candidatus Scatomorpha stercoravium]|nr:methyltransferase domain-containing protein [Candidatus Scatomorpha stercoravium]
MLERSQKYDRSFVRRCMAGPNALYLTEELTDSMSLAPGMAVLDLGCGRALSSVFLAREYGVTVYAVDKNEDAETCNMLRDVGCDKSVYPIRADAASLPIPAGIIDALVCVNAYHNFGMEAGFFEAKLKPLLKPGAQVGLVLCGRRAECVKPDDMNENPVFWSAAEWRRWFESEGLGIDVCEELESTERAWKEWMTISMPELSEDELSRVKINPELALIKIVGCI